MAWEKVKLGDIAICIQPGPFGSQLHNSDYSESGTPIIMPKDMIDGKISHSNLIFVGEEHTKRLCRHQVHAGNLMVARKGDVRKCVFITENEDGWMTGSDCLKVALKENYCYPRFIYYQLRSPFIGRWLEKISIGATMPSINTGLLSSIELVLPSLKEQKRITDILSAYDNLIENNQKQIKLLEEAAQRLYKQWFIDLRFPGHETTPIVGGLPEGWRKECLGNLVPILTGKKDANYGTADGKYPFFTCSQEPIKSPGYSFDTSAVILAGNGDFNVKLYRGKFEAYQRTYVLAPKDKNYLYLVYNSVQGKMRELFQGASGSTIKFLTKGMIESIPIVIPSNLILKKFNDLQDAIQKKIEVLKTSIICSVESRDRLLPKLMNGEM